MSRQRLLAALFTAVLANAPLVTWTANPARAGGIPDDNVVKTTDGCGQVRFFDYGDGLPGGGPNDDYLMVSDRCTDHHGVKVWAWLTHNGVKNYLGGSYDGFGNVLEGKPYMFWDPFKDETNVRPTDYVGLKICLVDGNDDPSPARCESATWQSLDGFARPEL